MQPAAPGDRIPCVGAVIHDQHGRLLLVRRANPPARGTWSLPGGRVESGEDDRAAVVREVREETGLDVEVTRFVGSVQRVAPAGGVYDIRDFVCTVRGGHLAAGDDASAARWFTADDLAAASTSPGLIEALSAWGVLPR